MKRPIHHKPAGVATLPPHDAPLEAAVLGAAMLEAPALRKALELLPDEDVFYVQSHRLTWRAMRALFQAGQQVDMLTVLQRLRADGHLIAAGGPPAIQQLTAKVTSGANIEFHARILIEQYGRRLIIQDARQKLAQADDPQVDVLDLLTDSFNTLTRLTRSMSTGKAVTAASLYDATIQAIARACTTSGLTGVPTGWPSLDRLTGGWQPGNLILLAARPGMGKTTVALAFARQAAFYFGKRVLFVSLEMPPQELMMKLIATEISTIGPGITTHQLSHGKLQGGEAEAYDIGASAHRVKSERLLIYPGSSVTVGQLRAHAAELKAEPAGLDLIIIDYVQLVKADSRGISREEQVAEVSRTLKAVALELSLPVMALAQLNRKAEERGGNRPQTSDLRESGQLEQDADLIIFPWRGEVYGVEYYEAGEDGRAVATAGTILLDVAKHRNGPPGEIILGCDMGQGRLWDSADPAWTGKPDRPPTTNGRPITTASAFEQVRQPDEEPAF